MTSLREELLSIREQYGVLTPRVVVAAARPDDAPLHEHFEWDDSVAGEHYREVQARELVRRVMVVTKRDDRGLTSVRAFVSIRQQEEAERDYVPVEEALLNPVAKAVLLLELRRELFRLRTRYGHLEEYAKLLANEGGEASA